MRAQPKVYVKISHLQSLSQQAYPYDSLVMLKKVDDTFGAGRLMWGTDWPVSLVSLKRRTRMSSPLDRDHPGFMPEPDLQQILHGTVQRVWPFRL